MHVGPLSRRSSGLSVVMTRDGSSRERDRGARVSAPDQRFALLRCGGTPSLAIVGARRVDVAPSEIRWRQKWKWR